MSGIPVQSHLPPNGSEQPATASLAAVFVATAARLPDKTALIFRDTRVTYSELHERTDRWAALLQARGIGPGQFVGIWLDRSVEMHAAILAVLKTGAAYLPFDPDAPRDSPSSTWCESATMSP